MIENYGFEGKNEYVRFDDLPKVMRSKLVDEFLIEQLTEKGLG